MDEFNSTHRTTEPTSVRSGHQQRFQASAGAIVDDRFELLKKIGEGGMGVVYLAKQINIGREVVIKLLKPHLCSNEEQVNRFHREASLASRLSHPNCVTIHDFGFYQGTRGRKRRACAAERIKKKLLKKCRCLHPLPPE